MSIAKEYPNLVMRGAEFIPQNLKDKLPWKIRGIYALLNHERAHCYNVVYIGSSIEGPGIRVRLNQHAKERRKRGKWTHFSFFEVWPNIPEKWVLEMEALFLHFFRKHNKREDYQTLFLNNQRMGGSFRKVMFTRKEIGLEQFKELESKDFIKPPKSRNT
jgi:hypothetical protein